MAMQSTISLPAARRRWALGAAGAAALALAGCVVAPVEPVAYGYHSTTVTTRYGHPPPPRVEYRSAAPSGQHMWVPGRWHWGGSRYDWHPGHWTPPAPRYVAPPAPPRLQPAPVRPQVQPRPVPRPGASAPPQRPPLQGHSPRSPRATGEVAPQRPPRSEASTPHGERRRSQAEDGDERRQRPSAGALHRDPDRSRMPAFPRP